MDSAARGWAEIVSIDFIFGSPRSGHLVLQYTLLSLSPLRHPSVSHVQLLLTRWPPPCLLSSILWIFFTIFFPPLSFPTSFFSLLACVILHPSIQAVLLSCKRAIFARCFFSISRPAPFFLPSSTFFIPLQCFSLHASLCCCFWSCSLSRLFFLFFLFPLICPVPRSHFPAMLWRQCEQQKEEVVDFFFVFSPHLAPLASQTGGKGVGVRSVTHFKGDFEACRLDILKKKNKKFKNQSSSLYLVLLHPPTAWQEFVPVLRFFPPAVLVRLAKNMQKSAMHLYWWSCGRPKVQTSDLIQYIIKYQYVVSFRWKCLENFHNKIKMFLLLFYCQLFEIMDTCDLILAVKSWRVSAPRLGGDRSNSRPGHTGNGVPQRGTNQCPCAWTLFPRRRHTGHNCYQLDQCELACTCKG